MNPPYHHDIPHDVLAIVQEKANKWDFYNNKWRLDPIAVLDCLDFYMEALTKK